jgi:hypothetical protein
MFGLFAPKNSASASSSDESSSDDPSQDKGSFCVEVEVKPLSAPLLEKDESGLYDLPIARAVVKGGTSTLAGLALALLLSSAPALANACPGRVVNTSSHSLCLRSTDKGEPRVDVIGTQVSMVRFVGGMLTMSGPYTRTVPDDRRLPIIFNSKTGVGAIAEAGSSVRAIEGNAAARKHLRIQ